MPRRTDRDSKDETGRGAAATGYDNPWVTLSSARHYDNPWIRVTEHQVLNPSGKPGIYGTVHFKNLSAGVVPIEPDGTTYLVGQYRYVLERYSWEIPEGGGPLDVAPVETARRELLEETGLVANRWHEILRLDLSNSVTDEQAVAYLAWGLEHRGARPDDAEKLQVRRLPFATAVDMVNSGEITDSLSVAAILKIQVLALTDRLPEGIDRAMLAIG